MSHFLITGGAGFIGTNIAYFLLQKNHRVSILDNLSTGQISNLAPIIKRLTFVQGDICDLNTVHKVMKGVDYVLHQAAWRAVEKSIDYPIEAHHNNTTGTLNVLLAARDAHVKRLVLASSAAVYGNSSSALSQESDLPLPASPYAVAKLACEHYASVFFHEYGLPTVTLRYFNAYGPFSPAEQAYSNVIPLFVDSLARGIPPTIHWHGQQHKDFVYVSDIAAANYLAATKPNLPGGNVFNIGSGETTTINDLLSSLQIILHTNLIPHREPKRAGDVFANHADITRANKILGWAPKVSLQQGLKKFVTWYLSYQSTKTQQSVHQSMTV